MKQWFIDNFDAATISAIITALATLAGSITALVLAIKSKVDSKKIVQAARERKTYTFCPHCKKKLFLEEMPFYLPDGQRDDDLNGIAD